MFDDVYLLLPVFNEEETIGPIIKDLNKHFKNIVVVDDGSYDNTRNILETLDVYYLRHYLNLGQGAAISTGLQFISKIKGAKAVITLDGDGQHDNKDVIKFAEEILKCEKEIIFGSRFLEHSQNIPIVKRLILKIICYITNKVSKVQLSDVHNGLKAIKVDSIEKINITIDRYGFESQIIHSVGKNNISYKELPTNVRYTTYSKKKGQKIQDGF